MSFEGRTRVLPLREVENKRSHRSPFRAVETYAKVGVKYLAEGTVHFSPSQHGHVHLTLPRFKLISDAEIGKPLHFLGG